MTSNQIAEKYNCDVFQDTGFDSKRKFWVALENYSEKQKFEYADGWTLGELVVNIEKQISKRGVD